MKPEYPRYAREVRELLANLDNGNGDQDSEQQPNTPPPNAAQDVQREIYLLFVKEEEEEQAIVDSVGSVSDLDTAPLQPQPAQQPLATAGSGILVFGLFVTLMCLFSIASQVYQIMNPFTALITLQARSQQITVQGTLQLGRVLNPITLSQSATVPTTGYGHQDAKNATGYLTFYNGQSTQVTVPAGTTLTSNSGEQIITDQDANIPPEIGSIPPTLGQATVPAHAIASGSKGNIPTGDINQPCCTTAIRAINTTSFSGGQDERNFQTVTKNDLDSISPSLVATVTQGVNAALQGQVRTNETFVTPSCRTGITSDHQPGDEATQVTVTVRETCSAVAYNSQELTDSVTQLLATQAAKKLGSGYGLLDTPQITVTGATPGKQGTLSFNVQGTFVFGISSQQQQHIKAIIAGKTTDAALQLLQSLPGIESASIAFSGFGDCSRIPKANIHLTMFVTS